MYAKVIAAAAALLPLCSGVPLDARDGTTRPGDEPCKQVSDHVANWIVENGIAPKNLSAIEQLLIPPIPAAPIRPSLAIACLKSMPLHKESALEQLEFLRPLFEWQSTVDYLRDPPRGYLSEGVDLAAGLDEIAAKLKNQKGAGYANELEFLLDLYTLTAVRVRDFHFAYSTLLLDLFSFPREQRFVSISGDGLSTPQIYLHDDINHAQHGYTPSPVSTIDGVPALEYLQNISVNNGWSHDPDARFNGLFPSVANNANPSYGHPEPSFPDLRDTTTVTCQNGTVFEFANTAFVRANFTNIASGADLYNAYGSGNGTGPQVFPWSFYRAAERNWTSPDLFAGYPKPVNATKTKSVAGFLPEGLEFSDVAVLSVSSFSGPSIGPDGIAVSFALAFQESYNVTIDFIRAAKAANRTKLILDVQGNSGGYFENMATLLFALFPATNFPIHWQARAHPQYAWLGAQLWNDTTAAAPWPMTKQINPNTHPWTSFTDFYGPYKGRRGSYTHPSIYNLSSYTTSFLPSPNSTTPASQYLIPWTTPPFPPENIILLTDGQCGSACALTTTMLTHTHGIRTLALGGRPLYAPMQAIGQTKGGPVQGFVNFPTDIDRTAVPPGVSISPSPWGYKPPLRVSGVDRLGWGGLTTFNVANTLHPGEDAGEVVPMQFRYEAANCRLFFTWEMARGVEAVWRSVADAAWRGGRCVPGSTTGADGRIGGVPPGYAEGVEDRNRLGDGPGAVGK